MFRRVVICRLNIQIAKSCKKATWTSSVHTDEASNTLALLVKTNTRNQILWPDFSQVVHVLQDKRHDSDARLMFNKVEFHIRFYLIENHISKFQN